MKLISRTLAAGLLTLGMLVAQTDFASAGRTGGPASEVGIAPVHDSIFYNIQFNANEPAVVTVVGNGTTFLDVFMYDADGHIARSVGTGDHQTVTMEVYRAGVFKVEVRNLGPLPNTFTISTN